MKHIIKVKFKETEDNAQTDIRVLGKSLANLADVIEKANNIQMGPVADLKFNIQKHKIGSDFFEIAVNASNLVGPLVPVVVDVSNILKNIGLIESDGTSLLELFKWKEKNPEHEITKETNGTVTITATTGDNSKIEVTNNIFNLATSSDMNKCLKNALEIPLKKDVNSISVTDETHVPLPQTRQSLPKISPFNSFEEKPVTNIIPKWLVITRPNLDKGTDFYFKDGDTNKEKKIPINDEFFVKEVLAGKDFRHGDMLFVDQKEEQYIDSKGKLQTNLTIEKVYEHKSANDQTSFSYD